MAETTRTTSGTPNQTAATPAASTPAASASTPSGSTSSSAASSGGARAGTNPSSTTAASPAATTTPSSTASSPGASRSGTSAAAGNQGGNQGQRTQTQDQAQQRQQNQGQQNQRQTTQGQQPGKGEGGSDEYHVELSGNAMSDAKKVGSELVGAARDSAMSLLDAQRARVADQIAALGDALRQSTESLDSTGVGSLAQYANQAADQISGFADTMRDRSWNELAADIEGFARRYPLTYMASALGIGFIAGRFLLSSSERVAASRSSGTSVSGARTSETRRDIGGTHRSAPSGARAEYGSTGLRE